MSIERKVRDLQAGDRFVDSEGNPIWEALTDVRSGTEGNRSGYRVDVLHIPDGGKSARNWNYSDGGRILQVEPIGNVTLAIVEARVAEIARLDANEDDEGAHINQDRLYVSILKAVAAGVPDTQEMAKEALKVDNLEFCRWYA